MLSIINMQYCPNKSVQISEILVELASYVCNVCQKTFSFESLMGKAWCYQWHRWISARAVCTKRNLALFQSFDSDHNIYTGCYPVLCSLRALPFFAAISPSHITLEIFFILHRICNEGLMVNCL